jgi:phosphoglycerate dehydrogenase-like enzyme
MPARWTLLALAPLDAPSFQALFAGLPVDVILPASRSQADVLAVAPAAEILLGDWNGALEVSGELVAAAPKLAFVQQPSSGIDSVDVAACTAAGVPLANSGSANAISVAEWCIGASFAALRSMAYGDQEIRAGRWPQLELSRRGGGELAGRRVGIVGMGQIGHACATRFAALGSDVAHWSRTRRDAASAGGAPWMPFEDLLRRSDVLIIVIALAAETRGLLGAAELALLPPGAFLINAARGGIVDEDALLAAIGSGALAGGALDVYATEPLPEVSPLRQEDRLLLSPHAAAATGEAMRRLVTGVVDNVRRAVSGEPVVDVVNGVEPVIRRREG